MLDGRRQHYRLVITLGDDDPIAEILLWAREELLPALVPVLQSGPVPVSLVFSRQDD